MGFSAKKSVIKFCPFCGGNMVSHVKNDVYICGHNSVQIEAEEKVEQVSARCNRSFRIMINTNTLLGGIYNPGEFRRMIGERVKEIRSKKENEEHVNNTDSAITIG